MLLFLNQQKLKKAGAALVITIPSIKAIILKPDYYICTQSLNFTGIIKPSMFNVSFTAGMDPDNLKVAKVIPIH